MELLLQLKNWVSLHSLRSMRLMARWRWLRPTWPSPVPLPVAPAIPTRVPYQNLKYLTTVRPPKSPVNSQRNAKAQCSEEFWKSCIFKRSSSRELIRSSSLRSKRSRMKRQLTHISLNSPCIKKNSSMISKPTVMLTNKLQSLFSHLSKTSML